MSFFRSRKDEISSHPKDATVDFCSVLVAFSKEAFGAIRVKEIIRNALSIQGNSVKYGGDGFPLLEQASTDTLKIIVFGIANELVRAFGTEFAVKLFERTIAQLQKQFSEQAITSDVMPIVPAGFLEEQRIKTLSKEDLERKVAEKTAEIQKVNDALEAKVIARTGELSQLLQEQQRAAQMLVRRDAELTKANDRLRKLDEVKSNFVSVVAHQLRTPLSGIKWTLNLLINGDLGTLTDEQKTFLFKAYESNDRMISLVNDMLGADRIDSGKVRYALQPLQMLDLVDNVLFELLPQANARSLTVIFKHEPKDLPKVHVDPERIRAVFQNLLENAVKYSRVGGTLEITMKVVDTGFIEVKIADDGIGIPKDQQKNIFERFFRATNAVKTETDGSGLGLYIVKNIVEKHGGKIWFEGDEGKGVTFYFTLPIYAGQDEPIAPVPLVPPIPAVHGQ